MSVDCGYTSKCVFLDTSQQAYLGGTKIVEPTKSSHSELKVENCGWVVGCLDRRVSQRECFHSWKNRSELNWRGQ